MTAADATRKLTTIVAADVAGYSRLIAEDEEATLAKLRTLRSDRIEPVIAEYRGRIANTAGDSLLIEFPSVVDALRCAIEFQKFMAEQNGGVPRDRRIEFRIGVNIGDVVEQGSDLLGDGVNIAARLESIADPGEITLSAAAFDQVRGRVDAAFVDLGFRELKNIPAPVHVYAVTLNRAGAVPSVRPQQRSYALVALVLAVLLVVAGAVLGWMKPWVGPGTSSQPETVALLPGEKPSIAILPFDNLSDNKEQEYFSDGITEDLITDLSKVSGLLVIARNSTFSYKGKSPDLRQVAKELGVRYVLEGSVRRAGQRVRINAQLIDATTGGHLWADRYDGDLKDVFGLQDKVTAKIVTVLAVKLAAGEQERIVRRETENTEAYDTFLKGWAQYQRQRPASFRQAIALFQEAAKMDPKYSRAYAALSATYWQVWRRTWFGELGLDGIHAPQFLAEEFLEKAMLDPTPLALQTAASMLTQQGRHADAINLGERAIALDPNNADSYVSLAGALSLAGQFKKAMGLIERAMQLNPHYPPSYLYELGLAQFGMEQFAKVAATLEKATALNPDDRWSQRLLLAAYGHLGRREDAAKIFEAAEKNWRGFDPLSVRAVAFWYPFKQPADAERLAEGLRRAKVPN